MKSGFFFLIAAGIFIVTMFDSLGLIFSIIFRKKTYNFFKHYRAWSKRVLWLSNVKIEVSGSEYLKKGESYIYITNHSSLYDIPIIFTALNDDVRIMYKQELEKVPIFGYGLKVSPFISIIRTEAREAMKSLENALESIKENKSVILFPEGTRSATGKLGKFKRGAFLLASRSGKRIVPIAIIGSNTVKAPGKYQFLNKTVRVKILEPEEVLTDHNKQEEEKLMERVWKKINDELV